MVSESKEEKLRDAIFGSDPSPKSLRFSLALEDVVVDVAVRKARKAEGKRCCGCSKCGGQKR